MAGCCRDICPGQHLWNFRLQFSQIFDRECRLATVEMSRLELPLVCSWEMLGFRLGRFREKQN